MKRILLGLGIVIVFSCTPDRKNFLKDRFEREIDSLIGLMTLEEKVGMIHASSSFTSGGVERLGIPELIMSDGPHGLRFEHGRDWNPDTGALDQVTYLPVSICLASTWNTDLGYLYGSVLGNEARYRGKDIILGPGVNIIRTPLNGRNFEYLSEDPILKSRMAVGYIKGVQDQGTAACVKHYIANNQELHRSSVDVQMSEQALREIYLPAFKAAVEDAGVLTVMGAYNKYNGQFCSHNEYLVMDILKGELEFPGLLMSDWTAVQDTREALLFGTDIEMGSDLPMLPDPDYSKFFLADTVVSLVEAGEIDESLIDEKIRRILRVMFAINMFGERSPGSVNTPEHQQVALRTAEEGIVLLKNEGILPLDTDIVKDILIVGDNATRKHAHLGGSSQVNALYEVTPLEGIETLVGSQVNLRYAKGYEVSRGYKADADLIAEAIAAARDADAVIFVGGWIHGLEAAPWGEDTFDSEGLDKESLEMLFGQDRLIRELTKANQNTVIVLIGGGPVDMNRWIDQTNAILQAWYPGMEGGTAIANILFGQTNPSGKLPMTFARKLDDYPSHSIGEYPGENLIVNYNEGIFVGYRYFDSFDVEPEFCFGHGLSYTSFDFSDLTISRVEDRFIISCTLTNSGRRDGSEVIQVYVRNMEAGTPRPYHELKAFKKVFLASGESQNVSFELEEEAIQYFNEELDRWSLEPGIYEIQVGSSSRDIRLSEKFVL